MASNTACGCGTQVAPHHDDPFMWDQNCGNVRQIEEFALRNSSQPHLHVEIPERNVRVPQKKSKTLTELLAKPRDVKTVPYLLMIAPPSDPRYLHLKKSEPTALRPHVDLGMIQPSTTQMNVSGFCTQVDTETPQHHSHPHRTQIGPHFPDPFYLQQLSALAAMAWSDCAQVGEKLRRIYEQTTSFTTPEVCPPSDGGNYPGSTSELYDMLPHARPLQFPSNAPYQDVGVWSKGSCSCCQAAMQGQPRAVLRRNFPTSRVIARGSLNFSEQFYNQVTRVVKPSLKRKPPPYDVTKQQPAAKKLIVARNIPHHINAAHSGDLLPTAPGFVANSFVRFDSLAKSHDLVVTPTLENHCYVSTCPTRGSVHTPGLDLNCFNRFFPTRLPSAIK